MKIIKLQKEKQRKKEKTRCEWGAGKRGWRGCEDGKGDGNKLKGRKKRTAGGKKPNQFWKTRCMNKNFLSNLEKQQQETGNVCSQLNT